MRSSILRLALWLAVVCAQPAAAQQPEIILSWDPQGLVCHLEQTIGTQAALYVLALPAGFLADGVTGAELRVQGFPADWPRAVIPNPESAVSIGEPLGGGSNIAFATCQGEAPRGSLVLLYTVQFVATSVVTGRVVSVTAHAVPSSPLLPCPWVVACYALAPFACAETRSAAINNAGFCVVETAPTSWSQVRGLYR